MRNHFIFLLFLSILGCGSESQDRVNVQAIDTGYNISHTVSDTNNSGDVHEIDDTGSDNANNVDTNDNSSPSNDQNENINENTNVPESDRDNSISFRKIQTDVFTPRCSLCHNGFFNAGDLNLSSASISYANLVGIGSSGKDGVIRVISGLPDDSYLIQKLEGDSTIVGDQMPQGESPLSPLVIQDIRDWIANGALDN